MRIAVFGGTGRTGRHVVTQALAAGHEVRVVVRTRIPPGGSAGTTGSPPSWGASNRRYRWRRWSGAPAP